MGKKRKNRAGHYGPTSIETSLDAAEGNTSTMGTVLSTLPPLPEFPVSAFNLTSKENNTGPTTQGTPPPASPAHSTDPIAAADSTTATAKTDSGKDSSAQPGGWQKVKRHKKSKKEKTRGDKNYPEFSISPQKIKQSIQTNQLQQLVLWLLADGPAPQWLLVRHKPEIRRVVVLLIPGLTPNMFDRTLDLGFAVDDGFDSDTEAVTVDDFFPASLDRRRLPLCLQDLADMFTHVWPVKATGDDRHWRIHSPTTTFLTCPIPKNSDSASRGNVTKRLKVSQLLMSIDELIENEYVLHTSHLIERRRLLELEESDEDRAAMKMREAEGWVETDLSKGNDKDKNEAGAVTEGKTIYSIDCEMCETAKGLELTRISVVDWDGNVVYDELVKPTNPITDYLTPYSGITEAMLEPVVLTLADVQTYLLDLFDNDTILIGQSLNADLLTLRIAHPHIIDTSCIYHHMRGPPYKASLKQLANRFLSRDIQNTPTAAAPGHDSVEDARACLDLVKLKLERGIAFGTAEDQRESIFKRLQRPPHGPKKAALVDRATNVHGAHTTLNLVCRDDDEVVRGVQRCIQGDEVTATPQMDFVWAALQELGAARGMILPGTGDGGKIDINTPFPESAPKDPVKDVLATAVAETVQRVKRIHDSLPPCTALIVYIGTGDMRAWKRMSDMQRRFRAEFKVRKWDELSVQWTGNEEQQMKKVFAVGRKGVGFMVVK